ncbi:hypothetical protein ACFQGR_03940 [Weissella sagaensis]|jgi:hypothetical protein|uniref:Uncharacterized protein n=1 Tax=Weissella sagaensis TaxID=2559928 RepID=A0ABW1RSY6_9LACO|nr:hypothetical protein [Weissella sagaensis]MBU7568262.1 hypothetical protein [Weissella hellenica]QDJ59201.1 hypothetical protein EFA59_06555 [Weissella hellenica]QEA56494.1 hypothetical protein FGL75_00660 [Weissella hellenica]UEG67317.1 hypothetical protein GZH44_02010 [Weissella hellenica]
MATLYTATSETITYALLVDEQQALVSQVYYLQTTTPQQSQIALSDMMALHTKQTQLIANHNYWLWPIDQHTNQFPSEAKTHQQQA